MNKKELSKLIGTELTCAPQCKFYRECDRSSQDGNINCIDGVTALTDKLNSSGFETILLMRDGLNISVLNPKSEKVISDIKIKQGCLSLKP